MSDKDTLVLLAKARTIEAEKRTALALLRTGILIFTVPLSIFTVLISASKFYDVSGTLYPLIILIFICTCFLVLGVHLVMKALHQIRLCDIALNGIKNLLDQAAPTP